MIFNTFENSIIILKFVLGLSRDGGQSGIFHLTQQLVFLFLQSSDLVFQALDTILLFNLPVALYTFGKLGHKFLFPDDVFRELLRTKTTSCDLYVKETQLNKLTHIPGADAVNSKIYDQPFSSTRRLRSATRGSILWHLAQTM